jgi:hypothetical protein
MKLLSERKYCSKKATKNLWIHSERHNLKNSDSKILVTAISALSKTKQTIKLLSYNIDKLNNRMNKHYNTVLKLMADCQAYKVIPVASMLYFLKHVRILFKEKRHAEVMYIL